jgi:hypothetical protein
MLKIRKKVEKSKIIHKIKKILEIVKNKKSMTLEITFKKYN